MRSMRALLNSLIDYAGLFPPAALSMEEAVRAYAAHRDGEGGWMLGRFVVTAERLKEFESVAAPLPGPWPVSVLGATLPEPTVASIESLETKWGRLSSLPGVELFVELPLDEDLPWNIARLKKAGARAKIRTGGPTPEMIPSSPEVARFLALCAAEGVAFKATAGLHHPLRCTRPLTYEADSPLGRMHGFLNVFLAAVFVHKGLDAGEAAEMLEEDWLRAFRIAEGRVGWRRHSVDFMEIEAARSGFARSFGSCSFEEPVADLKDLGLL